MNLLEHIPYGKENAISRKELEKSTSLCDRLNRELIERERCSEDICQDGVILSSSKSGGYWISDDEFEIREFNAELKSRIRSLQRTLIHNEQFLMMKESLKGL